MGWSMKTADVVIKTARGMRSGRVVDDAVGKSERGGTGQWRGRGAGMARATGNFWLGVARAWRGHGAGVARACPVPPGLGKLVPQSHGKSRAYHCSNHMDQSTVSCP
eukprot:gene7493-biopygen21049